MLDRLKELPKLSAVGSESGPIAVCAPGPSLRETWEEASAFPIVLAVKSAHDFLIDHGRVPEFAVTKDDTARAINRAFKKGPHPDVQYLIAGKIAKSILGGTRPRFLSINHLDLQKMKVRQPHMYKVLRSRGSGGFSLMCAYTLGFRELHLFGFDNCFRGDMKRADGFMCEADIRDVTFKGRTFRMNMFLEQEFYYIRKFKASLPGVRLIPHGDGVLSHVWQKKAA